MKIREGLIVLGNKTGDEKEKNRCRKKLKFLKNVILYLEHSPAEKSIERQLTESIKKIARGNSEFERTFPSSIDVKTRNKWMKEMGIKELRNQEKILSYILGSNE